METDPEAKLKLHVWPQQAYEIRGNEKLGRFTIEDSK